MRSRRARPPRAESVPFALIALIALGLGWAWWTGRLKGVTFEDAAAAAAFLLGLRFATTGKLAIGLPLMLAAIAWGLYRRARAARGTIMDAAEARKLLGVDAEASVDEIRAAHRRLIAKAHPDAGGSAELARRINTARDILVAMKNLPPPRAS
jgi:DnaJ homolog subfamily C member 19